MRGINWTLAVTIVGVGALAFLLWDIAQGAYSKEKLTAAGWTEKG